MIVDVVMPKMGESINEGTILEWRKEIGEKIKLDEILLEIGTDKVDSEIPSSAAGIVIEILAKPNDVIEVGEVIARIDTDSDGNVVVTALLKRKQLELKTLKKNRCLQKYHLAIARLKQIILLIKRFSIPQL